MTTEQLVKATQDGTVLYGVQKDTYRIYRCKIGHFSVTEGGVMDCDLQIVGKKRKPRHLGSLTLFLTRKEAKEYATAQMFRQLVEEAEFKVIDAEHYIIEDKDGKQWKPIQGISDIMCLSFDGIKCLTISSISGMAWCPADWTPAYHIGDKLTYKWKK